MEEGRSLAEDIVFVSSNHFLEKEEEENKNEVRRKETDNWSWGLPKEMIEMILERLGFPDNLRFAAVCVEWRRVTLERRQIPKYPWLVFSGTRQTKAFSVFSLSENRVYHMNIPWIEGGQCLGSCQGWVLASNPNPKHCFLFNPFSREAPIVELPYLNVYCWHGQNCIHKLILSSSPTDPGCFVIALMDSYQLAYCKIRDNKWMVFKDLQQDEYLEEDVAFYNGLVYALSVDDHQLMVFDMEGPVLSNNEDYNDFDLNQDVASPLYARKEDIDVCTFMEIVDQEPLFNTYIFHSYLVQSQEELLLVSRIYSRLTQSPDECDFSQCECDREIIRPDAHFQTIRFLVYKLVECNPESSCDSDFTYNWVKQSRLGDNQILFLGRSFCQLLSTVDCPGLKGNTIYFTDDVKLVLNPLRQRDMGIYHLDDGHIEPLLPFDSSLFNVLPFWIIPSI